ncbi:EAL domain-containing protein [Demequina sp. TTPB684]|uniref:EAL domain-containing protein n=1 Tax=unclassified Demequina TaxID=2620311 RepID=UPI001CF4700D|nr:MULTISPECIES: EAL domain-containing protein [unclassified Demequina]MCB2412861.1 EAL domain-containing protein [Demequina sp. TTPB684]UPU88162.1 EAL domain-containing protein [Demequina sp. TMPB413]
METLQKSRPREATVPCESCRNGAPLGFDITMAFQPIVDIRERTVFAYEALVRGVDGAGAASILERVNADNMYRFDQACRTKAVELASRLGMDCLLSINFMPNAVYDPATCIRATLSAARRFDFPTDRLLFELSEREDAADKAHLKSIFDDYTQRGFKTAIDDFGAGYAGLALLVEFQPHFIKLDMNLLRGIDADPVRQIIVKSMLTMCRKLGVEVIAEGIETREEYTWFLNNGVRYAQGYLFARPGFESLPQVVWP